MLFMKSIVLAVAIVLSAWVLGSHLVDMKKIDSAKLASTGSAHQIVQADKVTWRLTVHGKASTSKAALETLERSTAKLAEFLNSKGLKEEELTKEPVTRQKVFKRDYRGYKTNEIQAYDMSQRFKVSSNRVAAITDLTQQVSSLYSQGIDFQSSAPNYLYSGLADLKVDLISKATANAKARAEAMASGTNNRVGGLRSARTGVFQITPVDSTEVSNWGVHDTTSIEKKVTAVVNVTFAID